MLVESVPDPGLGTRWLYPPDLMRSEALGAGRVEAERREMEGGRDMSGFRLKIGLTPNSPSQAMKKR